ncbi:MAG: hypothetical protein HZA93_13140 [Verrucomicrobia bacterium]|nr:hypothetical protein [Verrucomicrobiota bacterium]
MKPLPCPFCRQQPKFSFHSKKEAVPEIDHAYWSLGCPGKPVACTATPMSFGDTKPEAIAAWNTRTAVLGESDYRDRARRTFQPMVRDRDVVRFKKNEIVDFLLRNGRFDLNALARMQFSDADRAQFAQLIGYSVSGYGELSYVPLAEARTADAIADEMVAAEKGGAS